MAQFSPSLFLFFTYTKQTIVSGLFFLILDLLFPWLLSSIISCPQIIQKELYKHQIVFLGSSKITYCFLIFTYYWMKLRFITQSHLSPQPQPQFCMVKTLTSPQHPIPPIMSAAFMHIKTWLYAPLAVVCNMFVINVIIPTCSCL